MRLPQFSIIGCCMTLGACGRNPPAPPVVDAPGGIEAIAGTERIGWDQRAADLGDLGTIRFAFYADNTRSELSNVSCAPTSVAGTFECSAKIPTLGAGMHTLQLASFVVDGSV